MKPFRWNADKNEKLLAERGVGFERIVVAIDAGSLVDVVEHPNQRRYPQQRVMVVLCDGYAHLVPFVEADDHVFLKTIIPSRKAMKRITDEGRSDGPT